MAGSAYQSFAQCFASGKDEWPRVLEKANEDLIQHPIGAKHYGVRKPALAAAAAAGKALDEVLENTPAPGGTGFLQVHKGSPLLKGSGLQGGLLIGS